MKALAYLPVLLAAGCIGLESLKNDSEEPVVDSDDTGPVVVDYGNLSITPTSVDFGDVIIGESDTARVVIGYEGDGDTIINAVSMGTGSSSFVIQSVTSLPSAITSADEVVVDLLFSPVREQDYQGVLVIETDMQDLAEIEVPLAGAGVGDPGAGPDISVAPGSVSFGLVDVGMSESRTLTVSNIGTEPFFLTDILIDHPAVDYDFSSAMPLEFDPGESREVIITWTPTAIGSLASEAVFVNDVPGEENLTIPLTGESDDICAICAPQISVDTGGDDDHAMSFACLSMLGMPDRQTVQVTNSGDQPLTIRDVYVNNDALAVAGEFSTNWSGSTVTLDPWQHTNIQVSYIATGTAFDLPYTHFDMNILHILSDATNEPDYEIALTGTGI